MGLRRAAVSSPSYGGKNDDPRGGSRRIALEACGDLESIHVWEMQFDQGEVERFLFRCGRPRHLIGVGAVLRLDTIYSVGHKLLVERMSGGPILIDQQNAAPTKLRQGNRGRRGGERRLRQLLR